MVGSIGESYLTSDNPISDEGYYNMEATWVEHESHPGVINEELEEWMDTQPNIPDDSDASDQDINVFDDFYTE